MKRKHIGLILVCLTVLFLTPTLAVSGKEDPIQGNPFGEILAAINEMASTPIDFEPVFLAISDAVDAVTASIEASRVAIFSFIEDTQSESMTEMHDALDASQQDVEEAITASEEATGAAIDAAQLDVEEAITASQQATDASIDALQIEMEDTISASEQATGEAIDEAKIEILDTINGMPRLIEKTTKYPCTADGVLQIRVYCDKVFTVKAVYLIEEGGAARARSSAQIWLWHVGTGNWATRYYVDLVVAPDMNTDFEVLTAYGIDRELSLPGGSLFVFHDGLNVKEGYTYRATVVLESTYDASPTISFVHS